MKPILINGFLRSGTTYLYRYLKWISHERALFEPITASWTFYRFIEKYNIDKNALIFHPKENSKPYFKFLYNLMLLETFLQFIKDFSIKEVTLHLYLGPDFIKNNWNTYLIIRYPVDIYFSILNSFQIKKSNIYRLSKILPTNKLRLILYTIFRWDWYESALELSTIKHIKKIHLAKFENIIVFLWTTTNYYAINSINPEKQLIIYEDSESYYKLLKWEEWIKIEPLRIKKYKARKKYEKEFYEIAKKLNIAEEFKELLSFFEK